MGYALRYFRIILFSMLEMTYLGQISSSHDRCIRMHNQIQVEMLFLFCVVDDLKAKKLRLACCMSPIARCYTKEDPYQEVVETCSEQFRKAFH